MNRILKAIALLWGALLPANINAQLLELKSPFSEINYEIHYSPELLQKAQNGDAMAQYSLAHCYESGSGIKYDPDKAIEWYTQAADNGCVYAFEKLGNLYLCGIHVEQDYHKALSYYNHFGDDYLYHKAACYYGLGNIDKTIFCLEKFCYEYNSKLLFTSFYLGIANYSLMILFEVEGYKDIYKKYYKRYKKESNKDDNYYGYGSTFMQGMAYFYGICIKKDYRRAKRRFEDVIKEQPGGADNARMHLGTMYLKGLGVEKDYKKAIEYLSYFENEDYSAAKLNLAIARYEYGKDLYNKELYDQAFPYLKKAAENTVQPISHAMTLLSHCYTFGLGTSINEEKGKYWLMQAAKYKDAAAVKIVNGFI